MRKDRKGQMEMLEETLGALGNWSEGDLERVLGKWTVSRQLRRKDFLHLPGQVEDHIWFVNKGVVRIFFPLEEKELTVAFGYEGNFFNDFPSFLSRKPGRFYVQALRATELSGLAREHHEALLADCPGYQNYWLKSMEQGLASQMVREVDLQIESPRERVRRLMGRSPHLFQLVPHKYIASYLKMTPETLSRIMKES